MTVIEVYPNKYDCSLAECFENYDKDEVIDIIRGLGYEASYNKKEKFFILVEKKSLEFFSFFISLKYGIVEFIWSGLPWGLLKARLDGNYQDNVRKPSFRNYNELICILQEALVMYEDYKREILELYIPNKNYV
ncbi:hypothetical protein N0M98_30905 [Paenibacillus doosanensis]|uniref:hypothetical protein n=1 Tax=Paenibacillus doosanensis TaxID=1229154 RepID=UPI00217F4A05|nr:hypothetical protein [Paenibacillus doosanensis]MCS7464512.1 hypothetical protein [Paenibacillus doosanensis]